MREIKFRAWDKKEKKMHYGNMELFDDMIGFRFGHFGVDTNKEDIELMQYTGLKDIKGKEIYADDICLCVEITERKINRFISNVSWDESGWFVEDKVCLTPLDVYVETDSVSGMYNIEVIGNIHEV